MTEWSKPVLAILAGGEVRVPRVLLVGPRFNGGGAETRLRTLATHLFAGTADVALLQETDPKVLASSPRIHTLHWTGRLSYLPAALKLRRLIERGRYDVALSIGLHYNVLLMAATYGMADRPALVFTENSQPDTSDRLDGRRFVYRLRRRLHRLVYHTADRAAANSIDGIAELSRHYGVSPERVSRIPNIVDPARLAAARQEGPRPSLTSGKKSICSISRLDAFKRVDTLIEAVSGLDPDLPWQLDIVGDGPSRGELEATVEARGLSTRVRFHGWQRNPYPFMASATVTVLCSTFEGFSNTVLESMALGTPVITSFCSSDARQMVGRGAALGFEIGDSDALCAHLARILSDPAHSVELGRNAAVYITPHITSNAIMTYERLLIDAATDRSNAQRA